MRVCVMRVCVCVFVPSDALPIKLLSEDGATERRRKRANSVPLCGAFSGLFLSHLCPLMM